jgi:hypothetical protein
LTLLACLPRAVRVALGSLEMVLFFFAAPAAFLMFRRVPYPSRLDRMTASRRARWRPKRSAMTCSTQ